jgi:flagellar export protein FliJ
MKSRETLIRLKKFQVDEKRRKVAQIEGMIAEFERMAGDLDREIRAEQERAGIHDPGHFAYPTYAKAATQRRENLQRSADELKVQLESATAALAEAFEEMKKVELLDERPDARPGRAGCPRAGRAGRHRHHAQHRQRLISALSPGNRNDLIDRA